MTGQGERLHDRHERMTRELYERGDGLPARYVFVLTIRCNLRCAFCPQSRQAAGPELESADWERVVDQLPDYARVTVTGGEPLLAPAFRSVMTQVGHRFDCNLISNGTLLTPENIDFLLSLPKFRLLSVSVDQPGNTNRDFTPARWERLVEMLKCFVGRRDALGSTAALDIKTVVYPGNAARLYELHVLANETLRCDTHAFQFLKGSPLQHAATMSPLEATFTPSEAPCIEPFTTVARELERIRRYSLDTGSRVFLHPKFADLASPAPWPETLLAERLNASAHDPTRYEACMYPWSSVHINADGTLFPCQAIAMGNVRTQSLEAIVTGEPMRRFRDIIRQHGTTQGCNRCGWLRLRRQTTEA